MDNIQLLGKRGDNPGGESPEGYGQQRPAPQGYPQQSAQQGYNQPAGFQPRPAAPAAPAPAAPIDIMGGEGADDLPF